jgi:hypothetical protein
MKLSVGYIKLAKKEIPAKKYHLLFSSYFLLAFRLYKTDIKPMRIADNPTLLMLAKISSPCKLMLQETSPTRHPNVKKTPFHAECVRIANQPFPLIHVLRLKKSEGNTNNQLA